MNNRIDLAKYFAKLGFKTGAEIGVWSGYYSEVLCQNIPGLKLYCIDSWDAYADYVRFFPKGFTYNKLYNDAKKRLLPYNCELIKKLSMDAVKDFANESLDFVYIDGNHAYEFVRDDIREWSKKVKRGGIVSGHDYYISHAGNLGIIKAVDEYVKEHGFQLLKTDSDRRCNYRDDRLTNWYFIKT